MCARVTRPFRSGGHESVKGLAPETMKEALLFFCPCLVASIGFRQIKVSATKYTVLSTMTILPSLTTHWVEKALAVLRWGLLEYLMKCRSSVLLIYPKIECYWATLQAKSMGTVYTTQAAGRAGGLLVSLL